jgi:cytochrome c2
LDTSLVSSDNINNPRTMNAVYNLLPRLVMAKRLGRETLGRDNLANKQFNDFVTSGPLTEFFQPPTTVWTPHVLKDGSDSVGALGALNRVYMNIGLFSEEWLRHFNPILGGKPVTPIQITTARANSSYWQATEATTPDMALFLLKVSYPHKLKNAPGGSAYLNDPPAAVQQGKLVFADNCAACHSSKMPDPPASAALGASCIGPHYLECFNRYWAWTQTDDFHSRMRQIVQADDFLDGNYLSTDARVPVTLLQTNACSPLATNAIGGNIWDNFSSASYKSLPSVGTVTVYDPFTGKPRPYYMPAGGRGYTRVPSLVSLWATAPYLLNNSVGKFEASPSVEARMTSFQDSISQMLWPERRDKDSVLGDKIPGLIDRTTVTSWLRIPTGYLPDALKRAQAILNLAVPIFDQKGIEIGPIPAGTPVDLLANFDPLAESPRLYDRLAHDKAVVVAVFKLVHDLRALPKGATDDQARKVFANVGEQLFALSKCPDYVVNRGHYFGTKLSDADKNALIAFLKTF